MARLLTGFVLAVALGSTADAQLAGLKHVLTIPGVYNLANGLGVVVTCTSGKDGTIGLEAWGAGATYITGDSVAVAAGATVSFATAGSSAFPIDILITPGVFRGHLRVVGTTSQIVCSAFLAEMSTNPAHPITTLPVVSKFKQK